MLYRMYRGAESDMAAFFVDCTGQIEKAEVCMLLYIEI